MSTTGLDVFDTTVQKTNNWLNDLMQVLRWPDKHKVYLALRTTLHALRDRLTVEEVAHLGAQLPMLIRGFRYCRPRYGIFGHELSGNNEPANARH
jgi:uncharacterized protein (DUF2267 family)